MQVLKEYLVKAEDFLRKKSVEKPRLEAQYLFSHVLGLSRIHLYTSEDLPLKSEEVDKLRALLVEKAAGKPTAYLTGKKEFFSMELKVNEAVLIPRPETEELVELVLENEKSGAALTVADLCTGSGCIAVALARHLPLKKLYYCDISAAALEVASENIESLCQQVDCQFEKLQSDLFTGWPEEIKEQVDIFVSNPPYVTQSEYEQLEPGVKNFEPKEALLVQNETTFFECLFRGMFEYLKPGGRLYVETNPALVASQVELLSQAGLEGIEIKNDLSRKERFLKAVKP